MVARWRPGGLRSYRLLPGAELAKAQTLEHAADRWARRRQRISLPACAGDAGFDAFQSPLEIDLRSRLDRELRSCSAKPSCSKRSHHLQLMRGQTLRLHWRPPVVCQLTIILPAAARLPRKPIINRKTAARNWLRLMSGAEARSDAWASTSRTSEVLLDVRPTSHRKYLRCTERPRLLLG